MASKLTCPECESIIRPAKPIAPGKKVKCPRCEAVFVVPEEEPEEVGQRAAKPAGAKTSGKAAKEEKKEEKSAAKKSGDEDEIGTYGYVKDPDQEDPDKKPKIQYGPDTTVRDPRGPATTALAGPAGKLQLVGLFGALGWLLFIIMIIFPALFPIHDPTAVAAQEKEKAAAPKEKSKTAVSLYNILGVDFNMVIDLKWYYFMLAMIPFLLMACYSAVVVGGGIQMQNLQSRRFGLVASVMAMFPLNTLGLGLLLALLLQWLTWNVLADLEYGMFLGMVVNVAIWGASAGVGVWCLKTLMQPKIIEAFAYKGEEY